MSCIIPELNFKNESRQRKQRFLILKKETTNDISNLRKFVLIEHVYSVKNGSKYSRPVLKC
jgi:hypothetical protein